MTYSFVVGRCSKKDILSNFTRGKSVVFVGKQNGLKVAIMGANGDYSSFISPDNTVKVKSATTGRPMGLLFLDVIYEPGDDLELKEALKTVSKTFFLD